MLSGSVQRAKDSGLHSSVFNAERNAVAYYRPFGVINPHTDSDLFAGANDGSSLVVMSRGTTYTQQSYKVADSFPFEWIKKKWREGFHITRFGFRLPKKPLSCRDTGQPECRPAWIWPLV